MQRNKRVKSAQFNLKCYKKIKKNINGLTRNIKSLKRLSLKGKSEIKIVNTCLCTK